MSTVTGYCWPQSVASGEETTLYLSAEAPSAVTVEILRDGLETESVWRNDSIEVGPQATPDDAVENGCGWSPTVTITVGSEWRSGLYLVRTGDDRPTAWLVVRPSAPTPGAPLLKLATNTWNAYNDVGGRNLYTGALAVSAQRPLGYGFLAKPSGEGSRVTDDAGDFLTFAIDNDLSLWHGMAGWAGQERRFVQWAEAAGIELDYAIDADLDRAEGAALLEDRRLLLSVGHDEYWTWGMRDRVEDFVAAGGNVAFLSGNTAYWQVRLEHDDRVMVAFKHHFGDDPVMGTDREHLVTSMWADPIVGRPEAAMTGVSFTRGGYHRVHLSSPNGSGGYEVQDPGHWLLGGTDLQRGDQFGTEDRVVGYECDGTELAVHDGCLVATHSGATPDTLRVVATAPARMFDEHSTPLPVEHGNEYELEFHAKRLLGGDSAENLATLRYGYAVLGEWTAPSGGTVVTTGCTEWAYGLGGPTVNRITRNLLWRLGEVRGTPANRSVGNLAVELAAILELCEGLTEDQWKSPTGCPGWTVQDNISHIIDFEAAALGWPKPLHDFEVPPHAVNALGESNELGVDARRSLPGSAVLAELRDVVAARIEHLWAMTTADLEQTVETPVGPGAAADLLTMRVMDCWSHEQDIRRALGLPGHGGGPVVDESLDYFARFLPYVVGKRAGAADGSVVDFVIGGGRTERISVIDGRAKPVAVDGGVAPTVRIVVPAPTFAALVGGRSDVVGRVPADVTVEGDLELGTAVVASLGFMP